VRRCIHFLLKPVYILLAFIWIAALTSCASTGGYPHDPETDANLQVLEVNYFAPNSECECKYNKLRLKYSESKLASDADLLKAMRDEIVLSRIHVYDIEFSRFQRLLAGSGNAVSVGGDLAVLTLSGLAAVTGGAAAKSALSAASGGIVGAQGSINKDLYYQKTIPAIISQMEANRAKVKLAIFEGLKLSDAEYSLQRAYVDLSELNDAGSIPSAISNITQASTEMKNKAQDEIRGTYATSASARRIRAWLHPQGKMDLNRFKALDTWAKKNYPDLNQNLPLASLLATEQASVQGYDLEAIRRSAVTDPTLNIPE